MTENDTYVCERCGAEGRHLVNDVRCCEVCGSEFVCKRRSTPDAPFLAAILADPDDDAPRLIYADWLDENSTTMPCPACSGMGYFTRNCPRCGNARVVSDGRAERAEFIRVQCRLAELDRMSFADCPGCEAPDEGYPHADDCPHNPCYHLRRRERELQREYGHIFAGPVAAFIPVGQDRLTAFRRGFVDCVTCTAEDWLRHAEAILAVQPVREVTLATWPGVEEQTIGLLLPGEGWNSPRRLVGRTKWRTQEQLVGPVPLATIVLHVNPRLTDGDISALLLAEWPNIRFTLPPVASRTVVPNSLLAD